MITAMKALKIEIKSKDIGERREKWWYACRDERGERWIEMEWHDVPHSGPPSSGTQRIELKDAPADLRGLAEAAIANAGG